MKQTKVTALFLGLTTCAFVTAASVPPDSPAGASVGVGAATSWEVLRP